MEDVIFTTTNYRIVSRNTGDEHWRSVHPAGDYKSETALPSIKRYVDDMNAARNDVEYAIQERTVVESYSPWEMIHP